MKRIITLLLSLLLLTTSLLPAFAMSEGTRTWDDLTDQEKKQTEKIQYISWRYFYYEPSLNQNVVYFGFMDSDRDYCNVAAPVIVQIRIEDDYGTELHSQTTEITLQDFSKGDKYRFDAGKNMLACVPVNYDGPNPENWHVYLYVKQYNGVYFTEKEITNNYFKLNLFTQRTVDGNRNGRIKFSSITYRYTTKGTLYLYFTGEALRAGQFTKYLHIYDEEGYSLDNTLVVISMSHVGFKFKDEEQIFFDLTPGTYKLGF